ncbi:MAG: radical SAM protein, partial [bacterium]|nr:radical SAM protein [bacterium]
MMAAFNHDDVKEYRELVKLLFYKTYYHQLSDEAVKRLNQQVDDFYRELKRYFLNLVAQEKPDVVGLTGYRGTLPASLFVFKEIKKSYPHIKTVMGGGVFVDTCAVGTPNYKILLEYSKGFLDKLIVGQGEILFLKYLRGELPESQRVYTKQDIGGQILPFQEVAVPDFSDLDLGKYHYMVGTASASCPNECSFCTASRYYGKHRVKDANQTVSEMLALHEKYGHQLFFMTDSLLNPVITTLSNQFIKSGKSLYYDTYFRVDEAATRMDNAMLWRRGGLYRIRLGAESGSQRILDMMGKLITPQQIRSSISTLASAGIKTTTYWVIGHPYETEEDFQKTLDLVEELKDDIYQAETNPFKYHDSMQMGTDSWEAKKIPLFPKRFHKMMVFESHTLTLEPLREEVYKRTY